MVFKVDVQTVKAFMKDEQQPLIAAQKVDNLQRSERSFNEDETSATLNKIFEDGVGYSELGETSVDLNVRELMDIERLTIFGEASDAVKETP